MEPSECAKCKKSVPQTTDHKCSDCGLRLCIECDDASATLGWFEPPCIDDDDIYLCHRCMKHRRKQTKIKLAS